jgi:hypothetical protein
MIADFSDALRDLVEHYRVEQQYDPKALIDAMLTRIEVLEELIERQGSRNRLI